MKKPQFTKLYKITYNENISEIGGNARNYGVLYTTLEISFAQQYLQNELNIGKIVIVEYEILNLLTPSLDL